MSIKELRTISNCGYVNEFDGIKKPPHGFWVSININLSIILNTKAWSIDQWTIKTPSIFSTPRFYSIGNSRSVTALDMFWLLFATLFFVTQWSCLHWTSRREFVPLSFQLVTFLVWFNRSPFKQSLISFSFQNLKRFISRDLLQESS